LKSIEVHEERPYGLLVFRRGEVHPVPGEYVAGSSQLLIHRLSGPVNVIRCG
jgi:hypothetical protein